MFAIFVPFVRAHLARTGEEGTRKTNHRLKGLTCTDRRGFPCTVTAYIYIGRFTQACASCRVACHGSISISQILIHTVCYTIGQVY